MTELDKKPYADKAAEDRKRYESEVRRSYAGFRLACRYAAWSSLAVSELQLSGWLSGNAALALSPSGIASELNRIQLSAICCGGQSGKVIDLLAWRCLPLGHPSAASGACAFEQILSSKRQCGKRQVSLKPAWIMVFDYISFRYQK